MDEQRFPMSVCLTGVMHKDKHKMYIASVLWSDQSDIVVYRTLSEFKKLHKQMKRAFPAGNKQKKSDRIIPKFKVRKTSRAGRKNGPSKSLKRLKPLQKYCDELLSCDPRVIHSGDLIQFFHPKDQELRPEFSKNSIIIMSTDDEQGDSGAFTGSNITQPFVTQTYRCVATYETKDTKNKPFKVAVDEKVDVLIKDKAGWWLVENEDKRIAWFPAPYLENLEDDEDDETDGISEGGILCTAIRSYKATKADEISVNIGSVVEVLQKSDNGWWLIRYRGQSGYVPTMYLQSHNSPAYMRGPAHHQERLFRSPSPSSPSSPSSLGLEQSHQLSLSSGNLLQLPSRSPSPNPLRAETKKRSRSLDILSEPQLSPPSFAAASSTPSPVRHAPPPTIKVEMDGEEEPSRNRRADSLGSLVSDSSSSDLSFSDDLSSSSASSILNLSPTTNDERLRFSRTPPPVASNLLAPTSGAEGKMMPSVSDPNLYKGPSTPKVPPRPRPNEIMTRCTTITRKNASRSPTPTPLQILSQ